MDRWWKWNMDNNCDSFDSLYISNVLTSLENEDTLFPPRFNFQGHNKGKKESKNNPPTAPSIFSVLILELPKGLHHPLCSSVPVLTISS